MDIDNESFLGPLPYPSQSSSQSYNALESNDFQSDSRDFFDSDFFVDGALEATLPNIESANPSPHPRDHVAANRLAESSSASPPQGSDSNSNSLDTSDSSSAHISPEARGGVPGRISIPADQEQGRDGTDTQPSNQSMHFQGDELFDFESAASSPAPYARQPTPHQYRVTMKTEGNRANFGFGPSRSEAESYHTSHPPADDLLSRIAPVSEPQPRFIHGSALESMASGPARHHPQPASGMLQSIPPVLPDFAKAVELHASDLPKTQRVETQMQVRLTMWPLPAGITKLHFQSHTMARTKLVVKPPPPLTPSMLELYAHCVCATAMNSQEKMRQAFQRAASTKRGDDGNEDFLPSQVRSLHIADDDPEKPLNGGFVFICDQCIRRENKRLARKKLKNEDEEQSWLEDQPKRIIVFNKAEIMDWQPWRLCHGDDDGSEAPSRPASTTQPFPDEAYQVRFPMRIQCYSRHHGEKLGYRVIFTIKDSENRLVAQTMTTPSIITDDHKTQPSAKLSNDLSPNGYFNAPSHGPFSYAAHSRYAEAQLGNRNSFSTPDLQSLHLTHHARGPPSQGSMSSFFDQSTSQATQPPSRNGSRPASPTLPMAPQTKRRKGSGSSPGRIRSDLAMTKLHRGGPKSPPVLGSPVAQNGPAQLRQPFAAGPKPSYSHSASGGYVNPSTLAPAPAAFNAHRRSQSVENLQGYQQARRPVSSSFMSQAASVESSPPPQNSLRFQPQSPSSRAEAASTEASSVSFPRIRKITPNEGPLAGGIEVTCLGDGFTKQCKVFFGDTPATTNHLWGPNAMVCLLPPVASPRVVEVTISATDEQHANHSSTETVYFNYVQVPDETLMRQTLQLINQQFLDDRFARHELPQNILTSIMEAGQISQGDGSSTRPGHQKYPSGTPRDSLGTRLDIEQSALNILEAVYLDDQPIQVDLNARGDTGHSLLHLACFLNYYRLVCGLLARGADFDVRDNNGMTPMHLASLRGNLKVIRKLRSSGADPTIRSLDGKRSADLANEDVILETIEDVGYHRISRTRLGPRHNQSSQGDRLPSLRPATGGENTIRSNHFSPNLSPPITPTHDQSTLMEAMAMRSNRWSTVGNGHSSRGSQRPQPLQRQPPADAAAAMAVSNAMSAWKEQISVQVQQLQQHLQRALPMMPTLPAYPAYPVMRRISNLVPQRGSKVGHTSGQSEGLKAEDYHWWELITGTISSPPAYEDIYPDGQHMASEKRPLSAGGVPAHSTTLKADPSVLHHVGKMEDMETLTIRPGAVTKEQQDRIRGAHARKMKKLRSDRNLFFIWIPLLIFMVVATARDWKPELQHLGSCARRFVETHAIGTQSQSSY